MPPLRGLPFKTTIFISNTLYSVCVMMRDKSQSAAPLYHTANHKERENAFLTKIAVPSFSAS